MLGPPELDAVLPVRSHQSGAEGQNHFPQPAGHTAFDAARDTVGLLGCKLTLPAPIHFFIHQYPEVFLHRTALNPSITQPASMFGIVLLVSLSLSLTPTSVENSP